MILDAGNDDVSFYRRRLDALGLAARSIQEAFIVLMARMGALYLDLSLLLFVLDPKNLKHKQDHHLILYEGVGAFYNMSSSC